MLATASGRAARRRSVGALALGFLIGAATVALASFAVAAGPAVTKPAATPPATSRPAARKPAAAKPATAKAAAKSTARPVDIASDARELEDRGAYALAAEKLRELRERTPRDTDLELAIALDDARAGRLEPAWQRLSDAVFSAALVETLPRTRYHEYGPGRWQDWVNGRWDGWHWYVGRARAEIAAGLGRWDDARTAARAAVAARPLAGKDWLILAVATARAGDLEESLPAARQALLLDPTLPEAHYLVGLFAWRDGRRNEAQEAFRTAVGLDSTWRDPALALVRSRLPHTKPDSFPARFLHGAREVALITSSARPKIEELHELDIAPRITRPIYAAMPDSLQGLDPVAVPVLVDAAGRIVLHELPYIDPSRVSLSSFSQVIRSLTLWQFAPAQRHGVPVPTWSGVTLQFPAAHAP